MKRIGAPSKGKIDHSAFRRRTPRDSPLTFFAKGETARHQRRERAGRLFKVFVKVFKGFVKDCLKDLLKVFKGVC